MHLIIFNINYNLYGNSNYNTILEKEFIRKELTRLELENERLSSDVQQQKQEVDFKVKELDKVVKHSMKTILLCLYIIANVKIK